MIPWQSGAGIRCSRRSAPPVPRAGWRKRERAAWDRCSTCRGRLQVCAAPAPSRSWRTPSKSSRSRGWVGWPGTLWQRRRRAHTWEEKASDKKSFWGDFSTTTKWSSKLLLFWNSESRWYGSPCIKFSYNGERSSELRDSPHLGILPSACNSSVYLMCILTLLLVALTCFLTGSGLNVVEYTFIAKYFLIHWRSPSTCLLSTFYQLVDVFCRNQWGIEV